MRWLEKIFLAIFLLLGHSEAQLLPGLDTKLTSRLSNVIAEASGHQVVDWMSIFMSVPSTHLRDMEQDARKCQNDLSSYMKALNYSNPASVKGWALKMFDATGKTLPPGTLEGAITNLPGNIKSCMEVNTGTFLGRYFLGGLYKKKIGENHTLDQNPLGHIDRRTAQFQPRLAVLPEIYSSTNLYGICLPDSCAEGDAMGFINQVFSDNGIKLGTFFYDHKDVNKSIEWNSEDHFALAIVCILGACIIIGTLVDVLLRHGFQELVAEKVCVIFQGFSLYTVLKKIFHVSENKDGLACINGIRFWSMAWVIIGHTYFELFVKPPFQANPLTIQEWSGQKSMRIIINASESVDSFFMIGGCLLAYLTLKEMTKLKGGSVKFWIMFYVHRYIRLTGALAGVVLIYGSLLKFMPYSNKNYWYGEHESCHKNWWHNLLYINNYKEDSTCLGHTWYLAVEMQLFLITPVFLAFMYWKPLIGNILTGIAVIATTLVRIYPFEQKVDDPTYDDFKNVYIKPWYRFGPYGIGLLLGSILYNCKDKQFKGIVARVLMFIGWIVSLVTFYLVVLEYDPDPTGLTNSEYVAYQSLFRSAWATALAFVVFATAKGYGGIIGSFLSWDAFAPLAKMTYSTYLWHFCVLDYVNAMISYRVYLSQAYMSFLCISNVIVAMGVGLAAVLLFEAPTMHLEKLLFGFLGLARLPKVNKYKVE